METAQTQRKPTQNIAIDPYVLVNKIYRPDSALLINCKDMTGHTAIDSKRAELFKEFIDEAHKLESRIHVLVNDESGLTISVQNPAADHYRDHSVSLNATEEMHHAHLLGYKASWHYHKGTHTTRADDFPITMGNAEFRSRCKKLVKKSLEYLGLKQ